METLNSLSVQMHGLPDTTSSHLVISRYSLHRNYSFGLM